MNSSSQAQKGFKTFLLTLGISLVVFSGIYYVINSDTSGVSTEEEPAAYDVSTTQNSLAAPVENEEVENNTETMEVATLGAKNSRSAFGDIAATPKEEVNAEPRQVLAGADTTTTTTTTTTQETSQTTVPITGTFGPTFGLIFSIITLGIGAYLVFLGPRKMALSSFEKDVIKEVDKK